MLGKGAPGDICDSPYLLELVYWHCSIHMTDCLSASEVILKDMRKISWIYHSKAWTYSFYEV